MYLAQTLGCAHFDVVDVAALEQSVGVLQALFVDVVLFAAHGVVVFEVSGPDASAGRTGCKVTKIKSLLVPRGQKKEVEADSCAICNKVISNKVVTKRENHYLRDGLNRG